MNFDEDNVISVNGKDIVFVDAHERFLFNFLTHEPRKLCLIHRGLDQDEFLSRLYFLNKFQKRTKRKIAIFADFPLLYWTTKHNIEPATTPYRLIENDVSIGFNNGYDLFIFSHKKYLHAELILEDDKISRRLNLYHGDKITPKIKTVNSLTGLSGNQRIVLFNVTFSHESLVIMGLT